jgi:hypothetical protein
MKKFVKTVSLYMVIAVLAVLGQSRDQLLAQGNCGNTCYPYYFCPGPVIACSSCPTEEPGLKVFAPGLPKCIRVLNLYRDQLGVTLSTTVQTGNTSFVKVFEPSVFPDPEDANVELDIGIAENEYFKICTPVPQSTCCIQINLETNPQVFKDAGKDPKTEPAFTEITLNKNECAPVCDDQHPIIMHLNFTKAFQTQGDLNGKGWITQAIWTNSDVSNLPSDLNVLFDGGVYIWNFSDLVTHELGHFVGYPAEELVAKYAPSCALPLDGILQNPKGSIPDYFRQGLNATEICWFRQLYCPDPCLPLPCDASVGLPRLFTDAFTLISLSPNPAHNYMLMTYSLTRRSLVRIDLFDILGRNMQSILEGSIDPGTHSIGVPLRDLPTGTYYTRVSTEGSIHTFKIAHIK